uniref:Putative site-specific DNA endonuclease n=1 Tax=Pleodorina starrii TaxID=330485 RepID=M9P831_9CHLO|nr:putative site-specific DNA endonuclease [Pleodorina starrii]AFY64452.1 putative site-specific DNA endonuclease [Pleodorina starrii]
MSTENTEQWNEWLAGLIDGDGCFYINKKEKNVSFEITTHITDIRVLTELKNKLKVGSVKKRSNSQSVRFRVKTKVAVIDILHRVNGKLYNPARVAQFIAACNLFEITINQAWLDEVTTGAASLTIKNSYAYLAGLIDADGTISISVSHTSTENSQLSGVHGKITRLINSKAHNQVSLKVTTQYENYATLIYKTVGFGKIYKQKPNKQKKVPNPLYHWTVVSLEDFQLLYEQFKKFPLKSLKMHRIRLVLLYFKYKQLKYHLYEAGAIEAKIWAKFARLWYKYSY